MPLYDYRCPKCGQVKEFFVKSSDLEAIGFFHCAVQMERQISAPRVAPDYAPYNCPITGKEIRGRREHLENLKKHSCRVLEPGETEQFRKSSAKRQQDFDKAVEKTIDQAARDLGINA